MRRAAVLLAIAVAALLPEILPGQTYILQILTLACCTMLPAIGLNILYGYAGLLSLGHMALAGVGGYTAALLMKQAGLAFIPALAAAALASGVVGFLVGLPCLRLRSHFFIIVTLGVGLILYALFNNLDWLTGGAAGLPGVPRPRPLNFAGRSFEFRSSIGFYRLALGLALAGLALQFATTRSGFGRALGALRQDEAMAAARGVDVFAHKLAAFTLSAAIAGIGGAMGVMLLRVAAPGSFDLDASFTLVAIIIIGGAGTLAGPLLGALIYVGLPEALRMADSWRLVLFGVLLVLLAIYAPRGLPGLAARLWKRQPKLPGSPPPLHISPATHRVAASRLEVRGIMRRFGGRQALADVNFSVAGPAILGLIGPNGAGKTTLFDIICGRQSADAGSILLDGTAIDALPPHRRARAGLARSFQECRVLPEETCLANMLFAAQDKRLTRGLTWSTSRTLHDRALQLLGMVGLAAHAHIPAASLSFGQRRLLEIASLFMQDPKILLLDEPASGVNPTLLATLHDFLLERAASLGLLLIVIEHNMEFLMSLAQRVIVLHQGSILADATPAEIQQDRRVIAAYLS